MRLATGRGPVPGTGTVGERVREAEGRAAKGYTGVRPGGVAMAGI